MIARMLTALTTRASSVFFWQSNFPWLVWPLAVGIGLLLALLPLDWAGMGLVLPLLAGALLRRPAWGLYGLVLLIPFGSLWEISVGVVSIGLAEVALVATLAAWIIRMLARRQLYHPRGPLAVPLLLFLGVAILSTLGSISLAYSLKGILIWVEVLAVYWLVTDEIRPGEVRYLVLALLVSASLQALLGIYQFFTGSGPESFVVLEQYVRAYGSFSQPNPFGGYMGLILPLALSLALASRASAWRSVAALALGLAGSALFMSWSRGAWLGGLAGALTVLGVGTWTLATDRRWLGLVVGGVVLLAAILLLVGAVEGVPPFLVERLTDLLPSPPVEDVRYAVVSDQNYAVVERLALWQAAWAMWESSPWLGLGIGNYVPRYAQFQVPGWDDPLGHPHNYYLQVAAETGLLGTLAYLTLWAAALWQALRYLARGPAAGRVVILGILGALIAFSVHNLVDNLYVHAMNMQIGIYLGLLTVIYSVQPNRGETIAALE